MMSDEIDAYDHEKSLLFAIALLMCLAYIFSILIRQAFTLFDKRDECSSSSTGPDRNEYGMAVVVLLVAIYMDATSSKSNAGLADLIQGTNPQLDEVLQMVPSILIGPRPPLLLSNRHLQFIPWLIQNEIHRIEAIPFDRIDLNVTNCIRKEPNCISDSFQDTISLDVFPPFEAASPFSANFNNSSPVILFSPGLRCHSQDMPGNMIIRKAFQKGFRSVVVHRRGHTPGRRLKSPRWNLFGDTDDLEQVYWFLKDKLATPATPFFLHGISSGTAVTVTAIGKWDKRRKDEPTRRTPVFVSAVDVVPGYDTSKVLHRDRFLFPYNDILLGGVKDHFVGQNEVLLRGFNNSAVDNALAATNLQDFVDAAVPFAGYASVAEYYEDTNPINFISAISTPKLVLNAVDDPCCNIQNLYEQSSYPNHFGKTYAELIKETSNAICAVTRTGSHCPFLCNGEGAFPFVRDPLNGGYMLNSWGDQVSIDYYLATLEVFGDRRFMT